MSVLAVIVIAQWSEARLAATPIDARPWLQHLVDRIALAASVSRVVVVCHPECVALLAPVVPAGIELVSAVNALAWAALADGAELVAQVPVWQLFADPARLDALAGAPRTADAARVRGVYVHDAAIDLTGGAYVELFTRRGCAEAAAGLDLSAATVAVPCAPEPPELRLTSSGDAGWGVTLQRALLAEGRSHDLAAVDDVLTRARLARFDFWRDGVGAGPRRVLTARCLPAGQFARLLTHLGHLPSATVDVVCPSALADATAAMPGVRDVIAYEGPSFDLARLGRATLDAVRGARHDLCVVPRRTPDGHGFENVTPLGAASGAATAVWMDVAGRTGLLAGRARGWEPWVVDLPPWLDTAALRRRAHTALRSFAPTPLAARDDAGDPGARAAEAVRAIVARMDEYVACHALVDAAASGIDLAPLLLHQLPPVMAAHAAVTRLRLQGRSAAPRCGRLLNRALKQGVAVLADCAPGLDAAPHGDAVRLAADDLKRLTDCVEVARDGSVEEAHAFAQMADVERRLHLLSARGDLGAPRNQGHA